MQLFPVHTRVFQEDEDLVAFIVEHLPTLPEDAVLVVTSKIVALAEGRTAVVHSPEEKAALIQAESEWALPTQYVWLTIKDGMLMASAGIDESNANGKLILLPEDSFAAAERLWIRLRKLYGVERLGVLITDSRTMPLRAGVTGVSLGYAGFSGIRDYRGTPDIFDRPFSFSSTNIADGLAAAAVLLMGEGREQYPLLWVLGAPVEFVEQIHPEELQIPLEKDMYLPFFRDSMHKKTPLIPQE